MGFERMYPPKYFRDRADEFHAKANNCEHSETRKTLRNVARTYEDLAERAKRIRTIKDAAK